MALPLRIPCNCCIPFPVNPKLQSFPSITNYNASNNRRNTTAELQTQVGVPTHKVKVHDRQRGLVHEFLVPEVVVLAVLNFIAEISIGILDPDDILLNQPI